MKSSSFRATLALALAAAAVAASSYNAAAQDAYPSRPITGRERA